jgi:kynurenine 3-monooxygenase
MAVETRQKTIVVGAGPVGSLAALYAAQRGDDVELYELRGDLRDPKTVPLNFTKSINLALSERGINSIKHANCPGLLESVLAETIPMHGRMIHGERNGKIFEASQAYDIHGRFIRACDRAGLNKQLLDELEQMPNVKLFFNHKLVGADFKRNLAWFETRDSPNTAPNVTSNGGKKATIEVEVPFDFMIGADGAHSSVRYHLMKYARMDYQQEYIDTLWCEFHMTSDSSSGEPKFKISPHHLHIWPCGSFMFIAIPSADKSFTCTLFMSASKFEQLDTHPEDLIPFFKKNFPGVAGELIPGEEIQREYKENKHLPLISIKCLPYHYDSSIVILGDAAHAMVPFYGQGMNAGLEDVRVLYAILDKYSGDRSKALSEYTSQRHPDAVSISSLALRNYQEMSHDVTSPIYLLRKYIEERLSAYLPSLGWATQYSRISFGNERYSEVEKAAKRQSLMLLRTIGLFAGVGGTWVALWLWRWNRASPIFGKLGSLVASLKKER